MAIILALTNWIISIKSELFKAKAFLVSGILKYGYIYKTYFVEERFFFASLYIELMIIFLIIFSKKWSFKYHSLANCIFVVINTTTITQTIITYYFHEPNSVNGFAPCCNISKWIVCQKDDATFVILIISLFPWNSITGAQMNLV